MFLFKHLSRASLRRVRSPFSSDSRTGSAVHAPVHKSRLKDTVVVGKLSETDQVLLEHFFIQLFSVCFCRIGFEFFCFTNRYVRPNLQRLIDAIIFSLLLPPFFCALHLRIFAHILIQLVACGSTACPTRHFPLLLLGCFFIWY